MLSSLYFQRKKRRFSMSLVFCPFVPMSYSSCCREVYKVSLVIVLMSSCIVVFISANPFLPRLMSFRLYSFENFCFWSSFSAWIISVSDLFLHKILSVSDLLFKVVFFLFLILFFALIISSLFASFCLCYSFSAWFFLFLIFFFFSTLFLPVSDHLFFLQNSGFLFLLEFFSFLITFSDWDLPVSDILFLLEIISISDHLFLLEIFLFLMFLFCLKFWSLCFWFLFFWLILQLNATSR